MIKKNKKFTNVFKILLIALLVLSLTSCSTILKKVEEGNTKVSTNLEEDEKIIPDILTDGKDVYQKDISFAEYINNKEELHRTNIAIVGYIKFDLTGRGEGAASSEIIYAFDDHGNKIELTSVDYDTKVMLEKELKFDEKSLFTIHGQFSKFGDITIKVEEIQPLQ